MRLVAGLCRDPLGELTALPQTLELDLNGKGGGRGDDGGERKGKRWE